MRQWCSCCSGEGGIAIPEKAFSFFERACALGEIGGCASLGALYEDGLGTETNLEKASLLYAMACDGGDTQACEARTALDNKAFLGNQAACQGGTAKACYHMAIAYEKGQGVAQSPSSAAQAAQKGCDGDDMASCTKLGFYYIEGIGVRADFSKAHQYFQNACSKDYGPGCFSLGLLYLEGRASPNLHHRRPLLLEILLAWRWTSCHHGAFCASKAIPPISTEPSLCSIRAVPLSLRTLCSTRRPSPRNAGGLYGSL